MADNKTIHYFSKHGRLHLGLGEGLSAQFRNGAFSTSDPVIQEALAVHPWFGKKFMTTGTLQTIPGPKIAKEAVTSEDQMQLSSTIDIQAARIKELEEQLAAKVLADTPTTNASTAGPGATEITKTKKEQVKKP